MEYNTQKQENVVIKKSLNSSLAQEHAIDILDFILHPRKLLTTYHSMKFSKIKSF